VACKALRQWRPLVFLAKDPRSKLLPPVIAHYFAGHPRLAPRAHLRDERRCFDVVCPAPLRGNAQPCGPAARSMTKMHRSEVLRLAALRLYVQVFRILRPLSSGFLNFAKSCGPAGQVCKVPGGGSPGLGPGPVDLSISSPFRRSCRRRSRSYSIACNPCISGPCNFGAPVPCLPAHC